MRADGRGGCVDQGLGRAGGQVSRCIGARVDQSFPVIRARGDSLMGR